jgi:50S ribosomal protein L16 3-hydroxylase
LRASKARTQESAGRQSRRRDEVYSPGLASLVWPLSAEKFMADAWSKRVSVSRRPATALTGLLDALAKAPIDALLRAAAPPVLVMYQTREGVYGASDVAVSEARGLFEAGMTLYFDLRRTIPDVEQWIAAVARDLGCDESRVVASLFVSPDGAKTECHFDANENFTVQLRGTKHWSIVPNGDVVLPLDRFTISAELPKRVMRYCSELTFLSMPATVAPIVVHPGTMIFAPRAHWHEVVAEGECVSFNLAVRPQSIASVVAALVERRLLSLERWRGDTIGSGLSGRAALAERLRELPEVIGGLRVEEVFPPSSRPDMVELRRDELLRKSHMASLGWGRRQTGDRLKMLLEIPGEPGLMTLDVAPPLKNLYSALARAESPFTLRELEARFLDHPTAEIEAVVRQLVRLGFLLRLDFGAAVSP